MQGAYQQKWGQPLTVISGGRSREEQAHLYSLYKQGRGNLAAPPGTSVHESGRAVDFGGAAHGFTPQQSWLASVAGQYGFSWTGRTFSQVEPWHFEYVGA
jgi:LAS superfamily LD-carboxypeptidase LdcB